MSKVKKVEETVVEPMKKSSKKKIFILVGAIILLIAILAVVIFFFLKNDKKSYSKPNDYPVVYLEDEKLVLWNPKNDKKLVIAGFYSKSNNKELNIVYANNDSSKFAFLNDGKLMLGNLSKEDVEDVDSDVLEKYDSYETMLFSKDDKYLVYVSTNKKIYAVNTSKKTKASLGSADDDQDIEFITITDDSVYYAIKNDDEIEAIYCASLDGSKKEKIANDVVSYIKNKDESRILYYISEDNNSYTYYEIVVASSKVSKLENDVTMYSISEDFKEYTYIKVGEEINILDDDELGKDPEIETTVKEVCTYTYYQEGLCSYNDWYFDKKINVTKKTSKKEVNDSIRDYAKSYTGKELYLKSNGENELTAENVTDVFYSNYENNVAFYKAIDTSVKVKISDLKSLEEFKKFISDHSKYFVYMDGKAKEVTVPVNIEISYGFAAQDNFYILDVNQNLYIVEFKENVGSLEKIAENIINYYNEYEGETIIYGNYDNSNYTYTIKSLSGKTVKDIATKVDRIITKNDKLFISNNCSNNACDKSVYIDKKLETIVPDAYLANIFDSNKGYIIKNYSSKNETYDLYRYENGEIKQIAFDIPVGYTSVNTMN